MKSRLIAVRPLVVLTSALFALAAFAAEPPKAGTAEMKAGTAGLTDANIAAIVVAANTIDIENAKVALSHTKNAEVKKFAQQMVTDHTSVNKQAGDLAKKLKLTPKDNDTSRDLKKGADATRAKLKGMKGAEFDKAYVDNEVAYHQAVLDTIDKTLIPNAQNAELKGLLEKVRPAIAAHLDHAKQVQTALSK